MTRFRLDLAYDGTCFHGWAAQPEQRTVQGVLQDAINEALALAGHQMLQQVTVAGRTDAGVHARGQVAHLDAEVELADAPKLAAQLARLLPDDIVLYALTPALPGFDARFAAISRTYCYRLCDAESRGDPMQRHVVTSVPYQLDVAVMHAAAQSLLGLRDFAPFCRAKEGGTTIRELQRFDVARCDDASGTIECWLRADAFAQAMVRSLVGAVTAVGSRQRDSTWLAGVAGASQRANDVTVMPAKGLTLEVVEYPPDDQLATRAAQARQLRTLEKGTS